MIDKRNSQRKMITDSVWTSNPVGAIHESPLPMTITQRRNMTLPKLIGRFKMLLSKRINEMRDTLLPKLISCELRIKDAERFLKERGL